MIRNEYNFVAEKLGGYIVEIIRPNVETHISEQAAQHVSERRLEGIKIDTAITNDKDIWSYHKKIDALMAPGSGG